MHDTRAVVQRSQHLVTVLFGLVLGRGYFAALAIGDLTAGRHVNCELGDPRWSAR